MHLRSDREEGLEEGAASACRCLSLPLGWMQAVHPELEGGNDVRVSRPPEIISLQKDANPVEMKTPSWKPWATGLLQRPCGFTDSPQYQHLPYSRLPFLPHPCLQSGSRAWRFAGW